MWLVAGLPAYLSENPLAKHTQLPRHQNSDAHQEKNAGIQHQLRSLTIVAEDDCAMPTANPMKCWIIGLQPSSQNCKKNTEKKIFDHSSTIWFDLVRSDVSGRPAAFQWLPPASMPSSAEVTGPACMNRSKPTGVLVRKCYPTLCKRYFFHLLLWSHGGRRVTRDPTIRRSDGSTEVAASTCWACGTWLV